MNSQRQLVKIIRELCAENGWEFCGFSEDWLLCLTYRGKTMPIHCYKFPNNNAASEQLCDDKSSLSEYLTYKGVPCVPHYYVYCNNHRATSAQMDYAFSLLEKYGTLAVKPNTGTCGEDVYKVGSRQQLVAAVKSVSQHSDMLAFSPCIEIAKEYRCVVLEGEVYICFEKQPYSLVGDGSLSLSELAAQAGVCAQGYPNGDYVPSAGEKVCCWKHNLCYGAVPVKLSPCKLREELCALAVRAATSAGIVFASVDIICGQQGLRVLEINSGIMLEKYSAYSTENYLEVKDLYRRAIVAYFSSKQ